MSRSYKNVRPKVHLAYTRRAVMTLYGVSTNTISNWIKQGLRPSDKAAPQVFSGAELKRFHDAQRLTKNSSLRVGEFKCFSCKAKVFPIPESLERHVTKTANGLLTGCCPVCEQGVRKILNATQCERVLHCARTNASLGSLDEGKGEVPVGIGKKLAAAQGDLYFANDRLLADWQRYAERWSQKTGDARMAAIREFERFAQGKSFAKVTAEDAALFRDALKASIAICGEGRRSVSTVRHVASHLKIFFEWLVKHRGYGRLDGSLPQYFELPQRFDAAALSGEDRPVPTVEEAEQMLRAMPVLTVRQRRDRAMVAVAFLGALRADTVTSLLVAHLDVRNRILIQDGRASRTKNGKSLRIRYFPLPPVFEEVVEEWRDCLGGLGFGPKDAAFPNERHLVSGGARNGGGAVPVMGSSHAVTSAFRGASAAVGKAFSPHSAKHCIGKLGQQRCRTPQQFRAWSLNMGHESVAITQEYYDKMSEGQVLELIEETRQPESVVADQSIADMELMLRYHEHGLTKGTPEFEEAEALVMERRVKRSSVG
ncbi:site-specific integrase [Alphaproteobacteria bacterium KMM 3653]|uniref:Site-specific integrase n=1 Tax=Harenicola maris TaxID=2841044 RepID=A0AAP2G4E6_9RHOB|nr:site-specific integrase [Harenicola maris]